MATLMGATQRPASDGTEQYEHQGLRIASILSTGTRHHPQISLNLLIHQSGQELLKCHNSKDA